MIFSQHFSLVLALCLLLGLSSSFQLPIDLKVDSRLGLFGASEKDGSPEISRRTALIASSFFTSGGVLTTKPNVSSAAASIYDQVKAIETANYIGMIGKPIYIPNAGENPEKNLPQVKVSEDNVVEVSVNHGPASPDDYIQFIWLKDAKTEDVVLVKAFPPPTDGSPASNSPTLLAKVPSGVSLRPYSFCVNNGLWKGEEFSIP